MACIVVRQFAVILVAAVIGTPILIAQQSGPTFEVASVKPNTSGAIGQLSQIGKGSLTLTNMRVRAMLVLAFGINPERIVGAPSWIEQDRFDVAARAPADTPDSQLRPMLRTLLGERFRLVAHTEMRDYPVYALVVARAPQGLGPNLKASTICEPQLSAVRPCTVITGSDGKGAYITGGARTIGALVDVLQRPDLQGLVDRPVVDRTGLTGTYDFDLRFAVAGLGAVSPDAPNLPSIFTAIQEQLGLKLEGARGPVEVLVIDALERPTPD